MESITIEVVITECYGDRKTTALRARTDDVDTAVQRAIHKGYGKGKVFIRDNDISVGSDALRGTQYGQIMRWVDSANAYTSVTNRVSIEAVMRKPIKGYAILKRTANQGTAGGSWGNAGEKMSTVRSVATDEYRAWKIANPGVHSQLIAVHVDGSDGEVVAE